MEILGIEASVNNTVGLPVLRSIVDHCTAFNIAGQNITASRRSIKALHQAADMATR